MKLGILSDIHEANDLLRAALAGLSACGAERFVVLGDLFETGRAVRETVAILAEAGAVGVWGNHDLGLVLDPDERFRTRYGEEVLAYCATLRGRYEEADCLFTHAQAWMDPADLEQPWYLHDCPETPDLLARNFTAMPHRILFQGHYHRWLAATPDGRLPWQGEAPLRMGEGRYLVVIHAVCNGWCALHDTDTSELRPVRIPNSEGPPNHA
jgi:predicted phosphodiesterase